MFRLDTIQVSINISKYSIIRSYDGYVKCAGGSTCKLVDLYSACAVLCKIIYGSEWCRVVGSIHWLQKPLDGIPG